MSYSDYQTNQAVYDSVLQQTIVDSVSGISRSSIQDYRVTAGSSRRALSEASSLRSPAAGSSDPAPLSSSAASIRAQYRLVLTGTGRSYDDVRIQLEGAVQSGSFDASLRSNALAQGAAGLSNATSGSLSVQDETDYSSDDDSSSSSTLPIIVGVAAGGGALVIIAILWMCRRNLQTVKAPSTGTGAALSTRAAAQTHPRQPAAASDSLEGVQYWDQQPQPQQHQHWDQQPQPQQHPVPSAPPNNSYSETTSAPVLGTQNTPPCSSASYLYQPVQTISDAPVLAVAVSSSGPCKPGEVMAYAEIYTGESAEV